MNAEAQISCESCGADVVLAPLARTARCPYCDSPSVVDRPATGDRPDPVFAIPFEIERTTAVAGVRRHIRSKRLAPTALHRAVANRVQGLYVPTYLYSAIAASSFSASIGEDYWERVVGTDSKGRPTVKKKRRTEYFRLAGAHSCYLGDLLVTASRGIPNDEVEWLEPYDLARLRRYSPALVSGWSSEEPSLSREECLALARDEGRAAVARRLDRFMPGDRHSKLRHQTALDGETIDLTLVPIWVVAVRWREHEPPIRILVNGQTGEVAGAIPTSWAKVALLVVGGALGLLAASGLVATLLGLLK
ncbi:MAG: hypothetical protein PVG92_02760 [Holophagae bacterium]|jgi:hypothetical protein